MSNQIDREGTFTGTVLESALGQSSGGFPQWTARFAALKKWVNTPEELAHFGITEPGYVDWSGYDEQIVAFLVLFTDKGALKNYEQLMTATGWDGQDFQTLSDLVGKELLFRTETNTYKDKTSFQVNWIDAVDAPPERTLKSVDATTAAALNAKFLAGLKKPTPPAKPVAATAAKSAAPKPPVAKPATVAASPAVAPTAPASPTAPAAPTPSPTTAAASAAPVETAKAKSGPPKKGAKTPPPPPAATEGVPAGLPEETTKDAAWEYLNEPTVMGGNDAATVTDAWIAACNEVGENVAEDAFTPVMWAKVRNIVIKDLNLAAPK